jgi:hypothetical protein
MIAFQVAEKMSSEEPFTHQDVHYRSAVILWLKAPTND